MNILGIKCTKLYSVFLYFRFDSFIARCLGDYFLPDTVYKRLAGEDALQFIQFLLQY